MTDESDLDLLVDTTSTTTRLTLATVQIEAERLLGVRVDARPAQDLSQRWREDPRLRIIFDELSQRVKTRQSARSIRARREGVEGRNGVPSREGVFTYDSGSAQSKKSGSCHFAQATRCTQKSAAGDAMKIKYLATTGVDVSILCPNSSVTGLLVQSLASLCLRSGKSAIWYAPEIASGRQLCAEHVSIFCPKASLVSN
jgi:hypothetical protein